MSSQAGQSQMQQMSQGSNQDDPSLFRIMIASDHHLGYLENDQIRGDDSFNSFEEILSTSKAENVDFVILGGDLFHHHNPSKKTIIRTGQLLQKYVYGPKTYNYEVFCYEPNFKNKNLSVQVPIFIIYGNHDDPSGFENFSSIDIFSSKEVNYFGKINNYEQFDLYPILFTKGETKVALYGIGSIKDERLYLALQNKKVNFHRPDDYKNWFNILVVHQNRFKGHNIGKNRKNYLPESFIPSFIDLVIWGHEHECFTEPVYNSEVGFHIYQPGSSVATSLIQAESKMKHMGLCEIKGDSFRIIPVKLNTVRPFIYDQFELKDYAEQLNGTEDIEKLIERKIEEALEKVEEGRKADPKIYNDLLPIIRIKIEYSGYALIRTSFLIGKYSGKVANLNDMIQFWKKGDIFSVKRNRDIGMDDEVMEGTGEMDEEMADQDEELKKFVCENIGNYFVEKGKKNFINPDIFFDYLDKSVNGNEKRCIETLFKQFYESALTHAKIDNEIFYNLNPLESGKKDFSEFLEKIIDKADVNEDISNGKNGVTLNNKRTGKSDNKRKTDKNFHLESQNNFSGEKKEDKAYQDLSQSSISNAFGFGKSNKSGGFLGNSNSNLFGSSQLSQYGVGNENSNEDQKENQNKGGLLSFGFTELGKKNKKSNKASSSNSVSVDDEDDSSISGDGPKKKKKGKKKEPKKGKKKKSKFC
ncbi:MAG: metallophosphoesterase [archaeon]|nr:metallophosphoesterase [archaeon]